MFIESRALSLHQPRRGEMSFASRSMPLPTELGGHAASLTTNIAPLRGCQTGPSIAAPDFACYGFMPLYVEPRHVPSNQSEA